MKTGIFEKMSSEDYHALDAIGSSTLVEMAISPAHFYEKWKRPKEDPTPQMIRGNLIHSLLLEQDVEKYVPRPLTAKGTLVASNTEEYKNFLAANPGKTPVHPDDHGSMYDMLTAFSKNSRAMAMLKHARIECSVVIQCPITGLYLKARPDVWGTGYLNDLKSVSTMSRFERQLFELKYEVRMAHYAYVLKIATGEEIEDFFFTPYEANRPFGSRVMQLDYTDVQDAKAEHMALLNQVSSCMKDNSWPCYSDEIEIIRKPSYLQKDEISFAGVG